MDATYEGAGVRSVEPGKLIDVGAAAEGLAVPAEDDDPDLFVSAGLADRLEKRIEQRGMQRIDLLGPVEEDAGNPAFDFYIEHMPSLSAASREALKKVSSATLTTVLFKRGLRNVFLQGIFLLNRGAPRMVGEAFTLRYIPAREDVEDRK